MLEQIQYEVKYVGFKNEKEWPRMEFTVTINGQAFEYNQGIGHAKKIEDSKVFGGGCKDKKWEVSGLLNNAHFVKNCLHLVQPKELPKLEDVLYCLFLDASGYDNLLQFEEWAEEYGYDTDSRKAEEIYNNCNTNARKLHKALGNKYNEVKEYIESLEL